MESSSIAALHGVSKTYRLGQVAALADVTLELAAGQFIAIQGRSGCGKSTLLLTLGGLLRPDAGTVHVAGNDIYALSPERRARVRASAIGFVFQQFHLVPYLSVFDNVRAAQLGVGRAPSDTGNGRGVRERIGTLLEELGLADRQSHRPAQLSTGERQRVALARALLNGPRLLLADEPTGNLDDENAERVMSHLGSFARQGGAVLLVTHDPRSSAYAQSTIQMDAGRLGRLRYSTK